MRRNRICNMTRRDRIVKADLLGVCRNTGLCFQHLYLRLVLRIVTMSVMQPV